MSRIIPSLLSIAMSLLLPQLGHSEQSQEAHPSASSSLKVRSQEPKLPYPYFAEEVSFNNASAEITLAGTLTFPKSKGPFPAVILLHGSAPLDRDSSLFGHKPFLVWADHLTRHGIAVLRFDKRSAGKSTGNYDTATIQDFASDALAAIEYLKTRSEVNPQQIGLIGHSEGGITASLAASKSNDLSFVVLMATPSVNAEMLTYEQEAILQRIDGVDEKIINQTKKFRDRVFTLLKNEKKETAEEKLRDLFTMHLNKLPLAQRAIVERYYGPLDPQIQFFNSTAFRYWMNFEPKSLFKQISIPVLSLQGDLDFIVSAEQNHKKEVANKDYTAILFPEVNHMFQTCKTGSISEYANIDETTAPEVLDKMSAWILERSAGNPVKKN